MRIEIRTEPGGGVLAEHIHPRLEERYQVVEGEVTFTVDGATIPLGRGERTTVAPGVSHRFENTGSTKAHLIVEAEPALRLQESIEAGAELARTQKLSASGNPKTPTALVEAAALAQRYRETVILTSPPPAVQRLIFPILARFARRR